MAKKNTMDDGSYQKSQKLGNWKGRFERPQMSEWKENGKTYRIPLDADGKPAPGYKPIDVTSTTDGKFFGGRLRNQIKGTTETSDDGVDIHINKRRDDITGIKYNQKSRKFFDKDGNQVNDADLYYSDKVGIIKRDSTKPHFEDRYRGEYIFSKAPSRSGKSDIEGEGEERPSNEKEDTTKYEKRVRLRPNSTGNKRGDK